MSELSGITIRANSNIKLKMPSGMTTDWTYLKGTTIEQMLQEVAGSIGLKVVPKLESECDTYRDLCGELLKTLKDLEKRAGYMAHCCGFFTDDVAELVAARSSITKAEAVMGEKS